MDEKRNEIILFENQGVKEELNDEQVVANFAVERDKGLESIIGNIYQSFAQTRYL